MTEEIQKEQKIIMKILGEGKIEEIKIKDIDLDTAQPRQISRKQKIEDLSKDIKERGQLYPILVVGYDGNIKNPDFSKRNRFWLLDGERRIHATKLFSDKINAIIYENLTFLQVQETQLVANTKRVQISVEEMAKWLNRFKIEYLKIFPNKDPIDRVVELTGYSYSYFDMAEAINRTDNELKEKIFSGKLSGYIATEIEKSTKDKYLRKGMINIYKKSTTPISALAPRIIKNDLKELEKSKEYSNEEKETIAENLLLNIIKPKEISIKMDFKYYKYKLSKFLKETETWNLSKLKIRELNVLSSIAMSIYDYIKMERERIKKLNKYHTKKY